MRTAKSAAENADGEGLLSGHVAGGSAGTLQPPRPTAHPHELQLGSPLYQYTWGPGLGLHAFVFHNRVSRGNYFKRQGSSNFDFGPHCEGENIRKNTLGCLVRVAPPARRDFDLDKPVAPSEREKILWKTRVTAAEGRPACDPGPLSFEIIPSRLDIAVMVAAPTHDGTMESITSTIRRAWVTVSYTMRAWNSYSPRTSRAVRLDRGCMHS